MTDRHTHPTDAPVSTAMHRHPGGHPGGHPHSRPGPAPELGDAPPVQAPAESAAEQYRAIAEVTADWAYAIHITADDRAITDWMSSNVQQVTGFTAVQLGSTDAWLRIVHRDDRGLMRAHLSALQAGRASTAEYRVVTRSGETRWVRDYARPMAHPKHGIVQAVGGIRDITARRQAEMDRARLLSECELAAEQKQRLVSQISAAVREAVSELGESADGLDLLAASSPAEAVRMETHARRCRRIAESLSALLEQVDEYSDDA